MKIIDAKSQSTALALINAVSLLSTSNLGDIVDFPEKPAEIETC